MLVPSTVRRALFTGMLRFSIAQTMIFVTIDEAIENMKMRICPMEKLSIPVNRARRTVFETSIGRFETAS